MTARLGSAAVRRLRSALLDFFDRGARALPWRDTRDPYAVWVSEVMLQQTRVEAAIPYYTRWLERFPTVHDLAAASSDDVLRQWEGLGYYSRARNLHSAARLVCEQLGGQLPGAYEQLRALPGIGDYTAGAVASIAFSAREPAVDGNARRVLSRLLDVADPSARLLRDTAAALVPPHRPGDFNQALMELGSRVCTPRAPRCCSCPIARDCRAHRNGTQLQRPRPKPAKQLPLVDMATLVAVDADERVLITRRAERGLLARMWNFPAIEMEPAARAEHATLVLLRRLTRRSGKDARVIGTIEHTFSHRRERYICMLVRVNAPTPAARGEHAWIGADAAAYALPRAQRRIHQLVLRVLEQRLAPV